MSERKYSKLRGAIREKFGTQEAFAIAMGLSISMLSAKLNYRSELTKTQIIRACELLEIPLAEAHLYFFC